MSINFSRRDCNRLIIGCKLSFNFRLVTRHIDITITPSEVKWFTYQFSLVTCSTLNSIIDVNPNRHQEVKPSIAIFSFSTSLQHQKKFIVFWDRKRNNLVVIVEINQCTGFLIPSISILIWHRIQYNRLKH